MLSAVAWGCSSEEFVSLAIHGFLPVRSMVSPGLKTTWSGWTVTYRTWGVIAPVTWASGDATISAESGPTWNWFGPSLTTCLSWLSSQKLRSLTFTGRRLGSVRTG